MVSIRALERSYNRGDVKGFLAQLTEDVVCNDPSLPTAIHGHEAVAAWFDKGHMVFPDIRMEPLRTIGGGDDLAVEYVETGTHQGALPGPGGRPIPPTQRSFRHQMCITYRFKKGKVSEFRIYWDILGVMAQLGLGG